jgi:hypothetical protein
MARVSFACRGSTIKMLDIDGFLTSTEFLGQIASIIVAILTALVGNLIGTLFGMA